MSSREQFRSSLDKNLPSTPPVPEVAHLRIPPRVHNLETVEGLRRENESLREKVDMLLRELRDMSELNKYYRSFPEEVLKSLERIDMAIIEAVQDESKKQHEILMGSIRRIDQAALKVIDEETQRHEKALSLIKDAEKNLEGESSKEEILIGMDNNFI